MKIKINQNSILYPSALMYAWRKYHWIMFLVPFPLLAWWYLMDVLANVLDWLCIKFFVEIPLWGLNDAEKKGIEYPANPLFWRIR